MSKLCKKKNFSFFSFNLFIIHYLNFVLISPNISFNKVCIYQCVLALKQREFSVLILFIWLGKRKLEDANEEIGGRKKGKQICMLYILLVALTSNPVLFFKIYFFIVMTLLILKILKNQKKVVIVLLLYHMKGWNESLNL